MISKRTSYLAIFLSSTLGLQALLTTLSAPTVHAADEKPKIWLAQPRALEARYHGADAVARSLNARKGTPLSLATEDFDQDGAADLAVGYSTPDGGRLAIHRGNLEAFAPQSKATFDAIGRSEFPSPYLPDAQVIEIPVNPDFLAAGRFKGVGSADLVFAARGGSSLYVLSGDGTGRLNASQTVDVHGAITGMAAVTEGLFSRVMLGVHDSNGPRIVEYVGSPDGLSQLRNISAPGDATSFAFGNLDGDGLTDAAVVAGGRLFVLRGNANGLESIPAGLRLSSVALGSFMFDRTGRKQISALAQDGSVHIFVYGGFDPTPFTSDELQAKRRLRGRPAPGPKALPPTADSGPMVWREIESMSGAGNSAGTQILLRTRISHNGADDAMVLSAGQLSLFTHPDRRPGNSGSALSGLMIRRNDPINSPVVALSVRVNVDARPGVVYLSGDRLEPHVMMPLPDPNIFVNRTDDPAPTSPIANACNNTSFADLSSSCSLREAVLKNNGDTIMLEAKTYTLSRPKVGGDYTGANGALYVLNDISIVGASQNSTIIQAGLSKGNGVDMVIAVNEDINPTSNASASISNLTIRFGTNRGNVLDTDGDGGGIEFDTGTAGTATLTMNAVTLTDNQTTDGSGGGLAIFDFFVPSGSGSASLTNCIVQNNLVAGAGGDGSLAGGIWVSTAGNIPAVLHLTNTQVLNNQATGTGGAGGGILFFGPPGSGHASTIHGGTISGNQTSGSGGGISTVAGLTIDQGTVISNNTAALDGGGIYSNGGPDTSNWSNLTITGNTATGGNGGGIHTDNSNATINLHFSRITGNSAGGNGKDVDNRTDASPGGVGTIFNAQNNWWGTNTPGSPNINSGTSTCAAGVLQICFDPWITLTNTAVPTSVKVGGASTVTASVAQDNHGTPVASGNLGVLIGLPTVGSIFPGSAVHGTLSNVQTTIQANGTASETFTATSGGTETINATLDNASVPASIVVLIPGTIAKAFNPTTVSFSPATPSTITFSINNPNAVAIDANFADNLPSGMVVAPTPNIVNGCGGSVVAAAGAGSIIFTNAALPVGACTVKVDVVGTTDGVLNNSVTLNSTAAGNSTAANANLTVINPPAITKSFGAATIGLNGTTSLTFTINSTNTSLSLTGGAFTDLLPAGLVVATPNGLTGSCGGGTITAVAASSSVSLAGATIAAAASCTFSVNVTGTTGGVKNNSVQVSAANSGPGNTSNASITVTAPPVIIKAFGAASIPLNGSTSLTFTIQNNNTTTTLTGVGYSDTLPAGLVVSTPNGLTGSCGGGTITATQATNVISLSGATLAASTSCTFAVNVTGIAAGTQNNTTGNVTSIEGGTGGTASASINVVAPPSIAKAFGAPGIAINGTTSLTFTITNPSANAVAETGVAFTDTLPAGLVVATPNGLTNTCGGTATAVAGSGSISLTGGTIAASSTCTLVVNITGTVAGNFTNTTGNVTSTNGGTGNTATANLSVATPPTITKSFGAAAIPLNGSTSLSFTITNPIANAGSLTGVAFTDNLPAGLVIATPNGLTGSCGGGTITAISGAGSASLSGATLATNTSCTFSVNVTGTSAGIKNNSVQANSTNAGTGNTSNASITVAAPPVIIKAFGAASIPLSGSTSLTFTIQNNNTSTTLTGVGYSDTLPSGLVVATPNGLTGSCGGGTITATAGSGLATLSGATLAASTSCTFSINVTGTSAGTKNNTTANVTSVEGGTGGTASASINVVAPPAIAKVFNPTAIVPNAVASLTFTITNPSANAVAETGVAFTDTLPSGLVVATPNGLTNTCGGTATAVAGSGSISLTGGTIAANSTCTLVVNVTGSTVGNYSNVSSSVSSTNGGTGNTASAGLAIQVADLTLTKSHAGNFAHGQVGATYSLVATNSGLGPTVGLVTVVDTLPTGLTATAITGTGWTCILGSLSCTRSDVLAPGASYAAITVTVTVSNTVASPITNVATVSGGGETNTGNDSASDPTNIGAGLPATITATGGTPQTITDSTSVAAFQATVRDSGGAVVPGATVTFTAGGGGTFSNNSLIATAVTDATGVATAPTFTAGTTAGTFTINATVTGVATPATFTLVIVRTNLTITPSPLIFNYNLGGTATVPSQTVGVSASIAFALGVSVAPGAPWLAASGGSSSTTGTSVVVSVNPAGLAAGVYQGSVLLAISFATNQTQVVPVTLNVIAPPTLVTTPGSLSFTATPGQSSVPSQNILLGAQNRNVDFTLAATAPWITVTSTRSTTPATLVVTVNPGSMAVGTYTGSVQVTAAGATNSPLSISVTLTISTVVSISPGGFENAASFATGAVGPNTIVALFGNTSCVPAPRVLVNGVSVEVIGFTSTVVTFTMPGSVEGQSSASVKLDCNGQQSAPIDIPIAPATPGIFTLSMTGTGPGAILNGDLTVNGASNAVPLNGYLAIYGTGFGGYQAVGADGLQHTELDVQAFVGGIQASVLFAGHAPASTLGLQQINIKIPPNAPTGPNVPIILVINGVSTQTGVTAAIRP